MSSAITAGGAVSDPWIEESKPVRVASRGLGRGIPRPRSRSGAPDNAMTSPTGLREIFLRILAHLAIFTGGDADTLIILAEASKQFCLPYVSFLELEEKG